MLQLGAERGVLAQYAKRLITSAFHCSRRAAITKAWKSRGGIWHLCNTSSSLAQAISSWTLHLTMSPLARTGSLLAPSSCALLSFTAHSCLLTHCNHNHAIKKQVHPILSEKWAHLLPVMLHWCGSLALMRHPCDLKQLVGTTSTTPGVRFSLPMPLPAKAHDYGR